MSTRKQLRGCQRCGGQMFREVYQQSCRDCRETGGVVCEMCWVLVEWSCLQCGQSESAPRVRRKDYRVTT